MQKQSAQSSDVLPKNHDLDTKIAGTMTVLFALQCFHVLFLGLHDWIPLGTLDDVKAVRAANPFHKLVAGTLISLTPFAIGLAGSAIYFGRACPAWLFWWLWISYGFLIRR